MSSGRSISTLFTPDDWEYHQTTSRYIRNLFNIGNSAVFRRCLAVRGHCASACRAPGHFGGLPNGPYPAC